MKLHPMRCFFWAAILTGGCASRQAVYQEVHSNRQAAVRRWERTIEEKDAAAPRIEGSYSMADCVALALRHNKQLHAMIEEKEKAQGRITEAWSEALPKVYMEGRYTRLDKPQSFEMGGRTMEIGKRDNYEVSASLRVPLFRGGAVSAGIRAAHLYRYFTDERVREVVQNVVFETRKSYLDVVLAEQLVESARTGAELAERHLQDVQRKFAQGVVSRFDLLRAESELARLRAELVRAEDRLRLARVALCKTLGVSQESRLTLAERLEYREVEAEIVEAAMQALQRRPELLAGEMAVMMSQEGIVAARAGYLPTIDLFFAPLYARPDPHEATHDAWDKAWRAGAILSWPLFDAFRTAGRLTQARAAFRQQKAKLAEAEERVLFEVHAAMLSLEDARKLVAARETALRLAEEALRLAEVGYAQGVRTELEVLEARTHLIAARSHYAEALHQHMLAKLSLERATGALAAEEQAR